MCSKQGNTMAKPTNKQIVLKTKKRQPAKTGQQKNTSTPTPTPTHTTKHGEIIYGSNQLDSNSIHIKDTDP
jgi:hypothetical protein